MNAPDSRVSRLIIIAWAFLLSLPFIYQPLHLDDSFYYDIAENVFSKPLFAQDMPYVFEGGHFKDLASNSHAPFVSYYIALAKISLPGWFGEEAKFHLAFALFPVIIGLAAYSLAQAFSPYPLLVALLIQATPVVVVSSHTLMSDVPALAFWLLAMAAFRLWFENGKTRHLVVCLIATMLASFAAYQSLSLVVLFALYAWLKGRINRGVVLACILPVLFVIGWFLLGYLHYGRFLAANTATFAVGRGILNPRDITERLVAILGFIGGTTIFPLGYLYLYAGWLRGRVLAFLLLMSVCIVQVFAPGYTAGEKILLVLLLSAGLVVLARVLVFGISSWAHRENTGNSEGFFVAAWFGFVFLYCIFIFYTSAARYILPLVPPLVIIVSREVHRRVSASRVVMLALLATTSAAAAVLGVADWQFAKIYQEMSAKAERLYHGLPGNIWFGGEWGFRHYMGRNDFRLINSDMGSPPVRGGDLILLPELASPYKLAQDLESMLVKVEQFNYRPRWPIRLLDRNSHAGFHSVHWGLLPFSFSSAQLESLKVYQVSLLSEKLPDAISPNGGLPQPYPAFIEQRGERKLALIGSIPMRIAYGLELPGKGKMSFGISALADNMRDGLEQPVEFVVRISGGGSSIPVFSHVVARGMTDEHFTVDLSGIPAKKVSVELEATAREALPKGARAAWIDFYITP